MTLEAERRDGYALDGCIEIGIRVDDDGIFAAHFENRALDPDLAGLRLGGSLVDVEADVAGAGEGDEAGLGMMHDAVAEGGAGAGAEVHYAGWESGFFQSFEEFRGDGGGIARGLEDDGVAAD